RVTTVGLKYPEHIRCRDHRTPPVDAHAYRLLLSKPLQYAALAVETMVFVTDQHGHRSLRSAGLLERRGNALPVLIRLDQVVVDTEGIQERLCVAGRRIRDHPVTSPPPVSDYHDQRETGIQRHTPDGIAGFHHAGILNQADWYLATHQQPERNGEGFAFAGRGDNV